MTRKNTSITIRALTLKDSSVFAEAVELLNRTQGVGLFPSDYLHGLVGNPDAQVYAAFEDRDLVGLGVAQEIETFEYYLPFDPSICERLAKERVGSFSTMAIKESLQGMGIGKEIGLKRLEWLRARGCTVIVGVSWVSGLRHTSNRVFEKIGFRAVRRVDDFYRASSLEKPFECPGCRAAPCACPAILFEMRL